MGVYHNDFDKLSWQPEPSAPWSEQPVTIPLDVYTSMREQNVRLAMERDSERQARYHAEAELAKRKEGE